MAQDVAITGMPNGESQELIVGADGNIYHDIRHIDGTWQGFRPVLGHGADPTAPEQGRRVSIAGMRDGSSEMLILEPNDTVWYVVRDSGGHWSGFNEVAFDSKDVAITGMPNEDESQILIVGAGFSSNFDVFYATHDASGWANYTTIATRGTTSPGGGRKVSIAGMPDNSTQVFIVGQ